MHKKQDIILLKTLGTSVILSYLEYISLSFIKYVCYGPLALNLMYDVTPNTYSYFHQVKNWIKMFTLS